MLQWAWLKDADLSPLWHGRRDAPDLRFDILTQPQALSKAVSKSDVILCLAGSTPATGGDMQDNSRIATAVLAACGQRPVLFASSAAVYGVPRGLCREEDDPAPLSEYGQAKQDMEQAVLASGRRAICLRIGNVAGADQVLGQVAEGGPAVTLDRFADGRTPRRSYVGPATLGRIVHALCRRAARGDDLPGILNVAAPGAVEMGDLLDAVPHPWSPRPAPSSAIADVTLCTERLASLVPLDDRAGKPDTLVSEWRHYMAHARAAA